MNESEPRTLSTGLLAVGHLAQDGSAVLDPVNLEPGQLEGFLHAGAQHVVVFG